MHILRASPCHSIWFDLLLLAWLWWLSDIVKYGHDVFEPLKGGEDARAQQGQGQRAGENVRGSRGAGQQAQASKQEKVAAAQRKEEKAAQRKQQKQKQKQLWRRQLLCSGC
jgi:hypothetical protein